VALDARGNVYIADTYNYRVRKVNARGKITTVAGNGAYGYSGDGGPATRAKLQFVVGVALDQKGNLYIADPADEGANTRIRRVAPDGTITTFAGTASRGFAGDGGPATKAQLSSPSGVAVDGRGDVYIADGGNFRVREVTPNGTISTVAGNGKSGFSGDGGRATAAGVNPIAVAVDANGNLYISDYANNRVRKVDTAGIIATVAGNGRPGFSGDGGRATSARLNDPRGLAVDSHGNLYIADSRNNRVRKVTPAGKITTVAGKSRAPFTDDYGPATSARLQTPTGVAVDAQGNLYIADVRNNRVRKVGDVSVAGISGRCSRATALRLFLRLRLGNAGFMPNPVAQVLCGPFVGRGSRAMAASEAIPSCGRTAGWDVFDFAQGAWHLVLHRNNGAKLAAVGSNIRETTYILRPGDAHCFPTGGSRSRIWHWNGTRFVAGPWKVRRAR
jgi:sugar lactone lactonase YvrE